MYRGAVIMLVSGWGVGEGVAVNGRGDAPC